MNNKEYVTYLKEQVRTNNKIGVAESVSGGEREIWIILLTDGTLDAARYVVGEDGAWQSYGWIRRV